MKVFSNITAWRTREPVSQGRSNEEHRTPVSSVRQRIAAKMQRGAAALKRFVRQHGPKGNERQARLQPQPTLSHSGNTPAAYGTRPPLPRLPSLHFDQTSLGFAVPAMTGAAENSAVERVESQVRRAIESVAQTSRIFIAERLGASPASAAIDPAERERLIKFQREFASSEMDRHVNQIMSNVDLDTEFSILFDRSWKDRIQGIKTQALQSIDDAGLQQEPLALSQHGVQSKSELGHATQDVSESSTESMIFADLQQTQHIPAGWHDIQWEPGEGPLLEEGASIRQLQMFREDVGVGGFGMVSIFQDQTGRKLAGKRIHEPDHSKAETHIGSSDLRDILQRELDGYRQIYARKGPHPNLVNVYGIANYTYGPRHNLRVMLMDAIPGALSGEKGFSLLEKYWQSGQITSQEYFGSIGFIAKRILDVTEHINDAEVSDNDIAPPNFLLNEETGEPILIDLGLWTPHGATELPGAVDGPNGERYLPGIIVSPETLARQPKDVRSDVYASGVTIMSGVERITATPAALTRHETLRHNGLHQNIEAYPVVPGQDTLMMPIDKGEHFLQKIDRPFFDDRGNAVRQLGTYAANTAYTEFINALTEENRDDRPIPSEARALPFIKDKMLSDDNAKAVIVKVLALSRAEEAGEEPAMPASVPVSHKREVTDISDEAIDRVEQLLEELDRTRRAETYLALMDEINAEPLLEEHVQDSLPGLRLNIGRQLMQEGKSLLKDAKWLQSFAESGPDEPADSRATPIAIHNFALTLKNRAKAFLAEVDRLESIFDSERMAEIRTEEEVVIRGKLPALSRAAVDVLNAADELARSNETESSRNPFTEQFFENVKSRSRKYQQQAAARS